MTCRCRPWAVATLLAGLMCLLAAPGAALAHDPPAAAASAASAPAHAASATAFDVVSSEQVALGAPDSPRASLAQFFGAVRRGEWSAATRYLVLGDDNAGRGEELARRLKAVIDDTGWIDLEDIDDTPAGRTGDGLPATLDEVARITLDGRTEAMRMLRRSDAQGVHWAFSAATVRRIDSWYAALPDRWLRDVFVDSGLEAMLRPGPLELLWWQWCGMVGLLVAAVLGGRLLAAATRGLLGLVVKRTATLWDDRLLASLRSPVSLAWALAIIEFGQRYLLLLTPAQRLIDGVTAAGLVFAGFWAVWQATGVAAAQWQSREWSRDSASARTLISVGGNFARGAILFAGVLAMLSALGYPIGTLLAGLGIGGLALAFGAQKTIANLFGSVAIAIDQPFRVGDLVQVDGVTGVVENIGLRSTRLRTPDRTLVSIPNGTLADQRVESYAARDRFRLSTTIGLTYGTTRAQVEQVISGIERVLRAHPQVWPDVVAVRFAGFGESSLDIDVVAWFVVPAWADFVVCREQALLDIMGVVEQAGSDFAFPTRTVHLVGAAAG